MGLTIEDFKGCVINPLQKDLLAKNPKLNALVPVIQVEVIDDDEPYLTAREFSKKEIENIFRYIILVYDPQSTLGKIEKELSKRKEQAAILAGLNLDTVEEIYSNSHPLVVPLTVGYLKYYAKSKEWAAICAFESTFWESITKLMEPISGKDSKAQLESVEKKAKIKAEVDNDIERLEKYHLKYFGGDEILTEKVRTKMTPEGMSKMFSK